LPLPTFLIIGAPKAGTTSLHEYLAAHPEIAMTTEKEPMCFAVNAWEERLALYARLFERPAALRGESSTAYASYPYAPEVPARVASRIPDARLVYMVRDPIPRTLSHYAQNLWDDLPVAPFDRLMTDLEDPQNMPVWCSRYATQLERWLDHFPAENMLIIDQRDLQRDRVATIRRVLAFVGADTGFVAPGWELEHNTARAHRVPNRAGRWLGAGARESKLGRFLTREVPRPALRPEQRARLVGVLKPEADRLRQLTGLSVDRWDL
jgi:hypothetical protein